jgi:hypothetical protein
MLKHILLVSFIAAALNFGALAQCTIDNSYTTTGYYPSSLPDATVNVAYDQTVQVVIPKDTVVSGFSVTITNATIDSIGGLPAGVTHSCNPSTCIFPGNSTSCIQLSGTPTVAGNYPLKVYYRTKTAFGTFPGIESQYTLIVGTVTSIEAIAIPSSLAFSNVITLGNNTKNEVKFYSANQKPVTLEVYNMLGNLIFSQKLNTKTGLNATDLSIAGLPQGVYILNLSNGSDKVSRRVVMN